MLRTPILNCADLDSNEDECKVCDNDYYRYSSKQCLPKDAKCTDYNEHLRKCITCLTNY